jgi:hypothetical protein
VFRIRNPDCQAAANVTDEFEFLHFAHRVTAFSSEVGTVKRTRQIKSWSPASESIRSEKL